MRWLTISMWPRDDTLFLDTCDWVSQWRIGIPRLLQRHRWIYNYFPLFISTSWFKTNNTWFNCRRLNVRHIMNVVGEIHRYCLVFVNEKFRKQFRKWFLIRKSWDLWWLRSVKNIVYSFSKLFLDYLRFRWCNLHNISAVHRSSFYCKDLPVFCSSIYLIFIYPVVCHRQNLDNPYMCYEVRTPLLPGQFTVDSGGPNNLTWVWPPHCSQ